MKKYLIAAAVAAAIIAPLQARAATVNFSFDFSNTSAGIEIFGEIDGLTIGGTGPASKVVINSYTQTSTIYTFPVPLDMTPGATTNTFTVDGTGTLLTDGNFVSTVTFAPNTTLFLHLTRAPGTDVAGIAQTFLDPVSATGDVFNATDFGKLDYAAIPSSTPLPAALPLFATGLGALGLLGWRRKRKAAAVAA